MTTTQTGSTVASVIVLVLVMCVIAAVLLSGVVGTLMSHLAVK